MPENSLIASLRRAVEAAPDDVPLRLHLAEVLLEAGETGEAIGHISAVLQRDPASGPARELMTRALDVHAPEGPAPAQAGEFDWAKAEDEVRDLAVPVAGFAGDAGAFDVERSSVRLADVGGMTEVKERLEAAFLAPMRNPDLRRMYGKSLRGGLLMYGPPGCGKTFLARAVAGELGAGFLTVSLADVLDMWIGQSEQNIARLFAEARRFSPCVLFLDEVDAIGLKRSKQASSGMRTTINQLLMELDSVESTNEGVFVLAASNHPWDVDSALLRPGRLDRTVLVLPPDAAARAAIIRYHLRDRPVEGIDLERLVAATDGFSGADLAHLCESATERAVLEATRGGAVRRIGMPDFEEALREVSGSIGPWFETARNVVQFANEGGRYDDLRDYMKRRRHL